MVDFDFHSWEVLDKIYADPNQHCKQNFWGHRDAVENQNPTLSDDLRDIKLVRHLSNSRSLNDEKSKKLVDLCDRSIQHIDQIAGDNTQLSLEELDKKVCILNEVVKTLSTLGRRDAEVQEKLDKFLALRADASLDYSNRKTEELPGGLRKYLLGYFFCKDAYKRSGEYIAEAMSSSCIDDNLGSKIRSYSNEGDENQSRLYKLYKKLFLITKLWGSPYRKLFKRFESGKSLSPDEERQLAIMHLNFSKYDECLGSYDIEGKLPEDYLQHGSGHLLAVKVLKKRNPSSHEVDKAAELLVKYKSEIAEWHGLCERRAQGENVNPFRNHSNLKVMQTLVQELDHDGKAEFLKDYLCSPEWTQSGTIWNVLHCTGWDYTSPDSWQIVASWGVGADCWRQGDYTYRFLTGTEANIERFVHKVAQSADPNRRFDLITRYAKTVEEHYFPLILRLIEGSENKARHIAFIGKNSSEFLQFCINNVEDPKLVTDIHRETLNLSKETFLNPLEDMLRKEDFSKFDEFLQDLRIVASRGRGHFEGMFLHEGQVRSAVCDGEATEKVNRYKKILSLLKEKSLESDPDWMLEAFTKELNIHLVNGLGTRVAQSSGNERDAETHVMHEFVKECSFSKSDLLRIYEAQMSIVLSARTRRDSPNYKNILSIQKGFFGEDEDVLPEWWITVRDYSCFQLQILSVENLFEHFINNGKELTEEKQKFLSEEIAQDNLSGKQRYKAYKLGALYSEAGTVISSERMRFFDRGAAEYFAEGYLAGTRAFAEACEDLDVTLANLNKATDPDLKQMLLHVLCAHILENEELAERYLKHENAPQALKLRILEPKLLAKIQSSAKSAREAGESIEEKWTEMAAEYGINGADFVAWRVGNDGLFLLPKSEEYSAFAQKDWVS